MPKKIHAVAALSSLLGVFFLARFYLNAHAGKLPTGRAVLYGLLLLGLLFMNGCALMRRSRSGYVIVAVVAALAFPGVLAQSLHLIVIFLQGNLGNGSIGIITCLLSLGQFIVTVALYMCLLSREVRMFVWNAEPKGG